MLKENRTTIVISKDVRSKLNEIGKKSETYNDIVKKLIKDCKGVKNESKVSL